MYKKKFINFYFRIFLISLTVLFILTGIVNAHPPSDIEINYDIDTNELNVNITHSVSNIDHYIESVKIYINEEKYNTFKYNSQPGSKTFSYNYTINAGNGDILKVIATCNQFGTLTREITLGNENNNSTPGFILISLIITAIIIIFIKRKINYFS